MKSPKSVQSSYSSRSLLSARSPRDQFKKVDSRKHSPEKSDNDPESPRRISRFSKEKSLSPKSPKSPKSPRTIEELKYPRIAQSRSLSRDDDDSFGRNKPTTPRSPHSTISEKDDFESMDMMRTMKKPMNDAFSKSKSLYFYLMV